MVKERLAVVVSPRLPHRDGLCTVVPLSTTASRSGIRYQCRVELPMPAPAPYAGTIKWAKCDMLATLSYTRMQLPFTGRDRTTGKRKYLQIVLEAEQMAKVRTAMLHALGLESLTEKD
ncbi:type II toxin-antitoxin system PemK/MazF family toxin [Rhodobacter sp. CZR27]|uniref:type II toxin-antitoxin system PemK/MazF family toxin n=1 Tax=Rhodobacter sp. CZR27 TaxID=2033869 RepID=UPI0037430AE1